MSIGFDEKGRDFWFHMCVDGRKKQSQWSLDSFGFCFLQKPKIAKRGKRFKKITQQMAGRSIKNFQTVLSRRLILVSTRNSSYLSWFPPQNIFVWGGCGQQFVPTERPKVGRHWIEWMKKKSRKKIWIQKTILFNFPRFFV